MKIISTSHISKTLLSILRLLSVILLFYSKLQFFLSKIEWAMCEIEIYLRLNRTKVEELHGILNQRERVTKNPGVQKIRLVQCDEKSGVRIILPTRCYEKSGWRIIRGCE
jgi:hypothetical protein